MSDCLKYGRCTSISGSSRNLGMTEKKAIVYQLLEIKLAIPLKPRVLCQTREQGPAMILQPVVKVLQSIPNPYIYKVYKQSCTDPEGGGGGGQGVQTPPP